MGNSISLKILCPKLEIWVQLGLFPLTSNPDDSISESLKPASFFEPQSHCLVDAYGLMWLVTPTLSYWALLSPSMPLPSWSQVRMSCLCCLLMSCRSSLPLSHPLVWCPSFPLPHICPELPAILWGLSQLPHGCSSLCLKLASPPSGKANFSSSESSLSHSLRKFSCTPWYHSFLYCEGVACVVILSNHVLAPSWGKHQHKVEYCQVFLFRLFIY